MRSYHVPLDEKALTAMVTNLKKWCPDHAPIWTCVEVPALAEKEMKVEIEVVAYDGKMSCEGGMPNAPLPLLK